jgi:hypothetical protein
MNPASPAQYLVRERLVGVWPVFVWPALVWPPLVWPPLVWPVDVGQGRVAAAGVARSITISKPCLGADWLEPLQFQ